ncbi:MAG: hypothetical protein AAF682_03585 [Planctomycetota bacterium]
MTPTPKKQPTPGKGTSHVRTRTPRPDELSREAFEFITAIDDYKRVHMRSFLDDAQVLTVAHELGWYPGGSPARSIAPKKDELAAYAKARETYRKDQGRLFPSWSEVFELLMALGYERREAA